MGKLSFGTTGLAYQAQPLKLNLGESPVCPRCDTRVYANEEKRAIGKSWHTRCFKCAKCRKGLDSSSVSSHNEDIYCSLCHKKEFGPKGYGFAGGASGLSTDSSIRHVRQVSNTQVHAVPSQIPASETNHCDPDNCPRCGKKVYFAEEVKALRRKFHRLCFKCSQCNKMLEQGRCNEAEGGLYCNSCYGRKHGPKGYGFAGGAGATLSSNSHPLYPERPVRSVITTKCTTPPVNGPGTQSWTEAIYI